MFGRLKDYIIYVGTTISLCLCGFFDNSTAYVSFTNNTPYINGNTELENDFKYTVGVRKIALFDYQVRTKFYKGNENTLSDNALLGAVNGWEYLVNYSSVRNRMHEFVDQDYWFKWSSNSFATKIKYTNKESRDLEYIKSELDKLKNKKIDIPDVDLSGLEDAIDNISKNVNSMKGSLESFEERLIKVEKRGGGRF